MFKYKKVYSLNSWAFDGLIVIIRKCANINKLYCNLILTEITHWYKISIEFHKIGNKIND